jgi:hypothetical protein
VPAERSPDGSDGTRTDGVGDRAREIVERQALYREVNSQIEGLGENFNLDGRLGLLCECGNRGCIGRIELSDGEYAAVRRFPTRFFVKPGHEIPEVERVVEKTPGYLVVEKFGEAGTLAARLAS